jgi:hypothetical protein
MFRRVRAAGTLVVPSLLLALLLALPMVAVPAGVAQAAGVGSLTGTVTDRFGRPVAGVTVEARSPFYGSVMGSATTSATGTYTIAGLGTTTYKVKFVSPSAQYASTWNRNKANITQADVVVVSAGVATLVDATLPPPVDAPIPMGDVRSSTFGNQLAGTPGCTDPAHNVPTAAACAGVAVDNVWGVINGPYDIHANGDPFATRCWGDTNPTDLTAGTCSNPPTGAVPNPAPPGGDPSLNPYYRPDGYLYAVEVAQPGPVTVEVFDAAFDARRVCIIGQNGGSQTGIYNVGAWDPTCNAANNNNRSYPFSNSYETGDNAPTKANTPTSGTSTMLAGPTTEFQLYNRSGNDLAINPNSPNELTGCTAGSGRIVAAPGIGGTYRGGGSGAGNSVPTPYKNVWTTLCTFNALLPGVYPLRVRVDNIPGVCPWTSVTVPSACKGAGQNGYALRATGGSAHLYPLGDRSGVSHWSIPPTTYSLANLEATHAGRTARVDLYDVGDGGCLSGTDCVFTVSIKAPDASGNPTRDLPCSWVRSDYQGGPSNGLSSASIAPCTVITRQPSGSLFNGHWLRLQVPIPDDYSCPVNNCGWKVVYNFNVNPASPGAQSDHTTWSVSVVDDLGGTVTAGGAPVANAPVEVYDAVYGGLWATAHTDAAGHWSTQLLSGPFKVVVPATGPYARQWYSSTGGQVPTIVDVTSGGPPVNVDIALTAAASVTGTVRNGAGQPVAGIYAVALSVEEPYTILGLAITDAAGAYAVQGLPAGAYKMVVVDLTTPATYQPTAYPDVPMTWTHEGAVAALLTSPTVTTTVGATVSGIDITAAPN